MDVALLRICSCVGRPTPPTRARSVRHPSRGLPWRKIAGTNFASEFEQPTWQSYDLRSYFCCLPVRLSGRRCTSAFSAGNPKCANVASVLVIFAGSNAPAFLLPIRAPSTHPVSFPRLLSQLWPLAWALTSLTCAASFTTSTPIHTLPLPLRTRG